MKEMMIILFSAILTENFILRPSLWASAPSWGVSKKLDSAVGMSVAVTFVMAMALQLPWPSTLTCWFPMGWITSRRWCSSWSLRPWYSWWRSS